MKALILLFFIMASMSSLAANPRLPFHTACYDRDLEAVELLLYYSGQDVRERDGHGRTALFIAISTNDHEIARLLLEGAPDLVAIPAYDQTTPLEAAKALGDSEMIALIEEKSRLFQ